MAKLRVYEIAEKHNMDKRQLVTKINDMKLGFQVNNFMSTLDDDQVEAFEAALHREKEENTVETRLTDTVIRRRPKKEVRKRVTDDGLVEVRRTEPAPEPAPAPAPVVRANGAAQKEQAQAAKMLEEARRMKEEAERKLAEAEKARKAAEEAASRVEVEAPRAPEVVPEPEVVPAPEVAPVPPAPAPVAVEVASVDASDADDSADVSDDVSDDASVDVDDSADESVAESLAEGDDASVAEDVEDDEDESSGRRSRPARKGQAVILGQIDPAILKARLAAEGKTFEAPGRGGRDSGGGGGGGGGGGAPRERRGGGGAPGGGAPGGGAPGGAPGRPGQEAPRGDAGDGRRSRGKGRGRRTVEASQLYDDNAKLRRLHNQRRRKTRPSSTKITQAAEHKRVIKVDESIIISDLARQMGIKSSQVIGKLMQMGEMVTINQAIDVETAELVADTFGYSIENVTFDMTDYIDSTEDSEETLLSRAPVVTIMGHVDHGKTSLLDALRQSNITAGEHGGITQHIGAYQVTLNNQLITFLDTPGHQAFTALRARGAQATDIVILVVAADDGVMPQTVEAISHARDAGVPIIVAINKIDKVGANPDRVKQALTEYRLIPEEWGGESQFVEVSALQQINLDGLLEAVLLQAELLELRANPDRRAQGLVIESQLDIGHGPMATMLVQKGTLRVGDYVVVGEHYGRVRSLFDGHGTQIAQARPSTPAQVTGLSGVPEAGEIFFVVPDEKTAREISTHVEREKHEKELRNRARKPSGLAELTKLMESGELKELKVIIKGDVQGSVEAVRGSLEKLGNDEVGVRVIHSAVGGITENDVNLAASSSDAVVIVGFNVRPEARAQALAEEWGIELLLHSVIYDVEARIKAALEGLLAPIVSEETVGHAEVRATFSVPKIGTIAGCFVQDGFIKRGGRCRVVRENRVIYTSTIQTLKRFKDDAREVKQGFECGLSVANFNDIKLGDIIESYEIREQAAKLD